MQQFVLKKNNYFLTFKMKKAVTSDQKWNFTERRIHMIRRSIYVTRCLILICLFVTVVCGCYAQSDNGLRYIVCDGSSEAVYQQVKTQVATFPDLLDNGQWISSDDASASAHFNDRRAVFVHKAYASLPLQHQLLAGLAALFAMLAAGMFHDSSSQTRGLMRIVSYIQAHDGIKGHLRFLHSVIIYLRR